MNTTPYELPASTYEDWAGHDHKGFQPTARQQTVIDAIQAAMDSGLYYSDELARFAAEHLRITDEQKLKGTKSVQNGEFGMDCYYARCYLRAQKEYQRDDQARARLQLQAGSKLGTLVFNDHKRITGVFVVELTAADSFLLEGKRGAYRVQLTANAYTIQCAIERAAEKNLRKGSFEQFCSDQNSSVNKSNAPVQSPGFQQGLTI